MRVINPYVCSERELDGHIAAARSRNDQEEVDYLTAARLIRRLKKPLPFMPDQLVLANPESAAPVLPGNTPGKVERVYLRAGLWMLDVEHQGAMVRSPAKNFRAVV